MSSRATNDGSASRVAVIGAGLMGHGIAQVFATTGSDTRIWDPHQPTLQSAPARIGAHLRLLGQHAQVQLELATSLADAVVGADLVVEAIPEQLPLKRELVARLDELAPDAIVATNTSVLRISEIAEGSERPHRVVGAHWWNPPYLIPVVEVVKGDQTTDTTVETTAAWLRAAGKTPVRVNLDVPGFVGNRMQFALWREAMHILSEGIADAETIDLVARHTFGARLAAMGPLENADFIGLDLTASILDYLAPSLSVVSGVPRVVSDAVARGDLGARSGRGILTWLDGERDEAESRLMHHLLRVFDD